MSKFYYLQVTMPITYVPSLKVTNNTHGEILATKQWTNRDNCHSVLRSGNLGMRPTGLRRHLRV